MAVDFNNTEIAYKHLSDKELKKAFRLFKLLNNTALSNLGKSMTMFAFKLGLPITNIVKKTIFSAFVGGESIDESQDSINKLAEYGVETILDYGVEAKNEEKHLDEIAQTLVRKIAYVKEDPNANIASAKVTALSRDGLLETVSLGKKLNQHESAEWERVVERFDMICAAANDSGNSIYIDAEESWMQNAIDDLVMQMSRKYNTERPVVFNTIQLYRHDKLAYLKQAHKQALDGDFILAVKLVRGAYMEKERKYAQSKGIESVIHKDKAGTDEDYNKALVYCVEHIDSISFCVASHNEESNLMLGSLLDNRGIDRNHKHILTSQLFGMGDFITFNLAKAGFNASKYLPYGPVKELIPYLIRRAQENSSVDGQTTRELDLIRKEMRRRNLL